MDLVLTQLTDLHINSTDDLDVLLSRTKSIVGAISEVIRKPQETLLILCVTGDIANTGSIEQYAVAEKFFDDIIEKISDRYSDLSFQIAFVPGNHDCDFSSKYVSMRNAIMGNRDIDLYDRETIRACTSIQQNFYNFVQKYVDKGYSLGLRKDSIFTENIICDDINSNFKNYRIKLHCINTAWCSQIKEQKNMKFIVPSDIEKRENDIVISMMHHGPNWFDWEGNDNWNEYHRNYSDIILIGHDHKFDYVQTTNYDSSTNYLIKGNQLYSSGEKEQSGFNIVKINLEDNIELFYTFSWKSRIYERVLATEPCHFERNKYKESSISIKKEKKEYLEEIEIDIVNKNKSPLLLSDTFVFPVIQGEKDDKPEKTKTYKNQEDILNVINEKKLLIIDGGKEYGKTALLKRLFIILSESELFPIMINGESIKSSSENEINSQIRREYVDSYNNINVDHIMQLEKNQRVCLIDDFDNNLLSDKSQKDFLEYICNHFGIVIITNNSKENMVGVVKNIETSDYFESNFCRFEIRAIRRVMKHRLIEKWLLLENPTQDTNSIEFQAKVKAKTTQVQNVIKTGYFSNTPIEFLLVLSYIDNAQSFTADYSRYSYIYDSLIREKINDIAEKDTVKCTAYMTLLQLLAYGLYENKIGEFFDEDIILKAIYKYNEEYSPIKGKPTNIIKRLLDNNILAERGEQYKFKYSYMYYYFAGSYIENVLSPEEKTKKIREILSNLSLEINFNIALFMAYSMSTEHVIFPMVKEVEESLLKEFSGFRYENHRTLLSDANTTVFEKLNELYEIPENSQIPELQEQLREHRDELEEAELYNDKDVDKSEQGESENFGVVFNDFTKLLRLIQFEGEILKNYAAKIKNQPRRDMIKLMGYSNLKLLGFFGNMISTELDKIIEVVERKAKSETDDKKINKQALLQLIRDYMGLIWSQFVEINVNNLAICWDTDMVRDDVRSFKEWEKSDFFDMVNVEYQFRISDSKLPVRDIEKCFYGKEKLDGFSCEIMKKIIAGYLMNYQYDATDKARVCELLGFNYRKLFLEEQKQQALEMIE